MYTNETKKEQPPARGSSVVDGKRFHAGSDRSKTRLRELNYDPIGELVRKYWEMEKLIEDELRYKSGELVKLNRSTGKEMNWYPDFLEKLLSKQSDIADKLLRYGYGRVPETNIIENQRVPPMIISGPNGTTQHTGDSDGED